MVPYPHVPVPRPNDSTATILPPRVALAHDWLCGYRGGEAVLDRIAQLVAQRYCAAPLYVMVDDGKQMTPTIDSLTHVPSALHRLPFSSGSLRRWYLPLYPWAVSSLSRKIAADHRRVPIDLVLSTSSAAVKGIQSPRGVPHLCYCHSPARYVWSQTAEYGRGGGPVSGLRRAGLSMMSGRFREWDRRTAAHVTRFLANSTATAAEVLRCYGRDAAVVHPPVRTEFFTPDASVQREGFWLVVSALEPYKRIDLAIKAANAAHHPLVIAGAGSHSRDLRRIAGPTVRFLGRAAEEALRDLYRRAALLIFPQVEDFGIVAAEAQACGLPVVARRAGGALDIVTEGMTGAFFDEPDEGSLLSGIERAPRNATNACRESAARFSESAFDAAMTIHIERCLAGHACGG